MGNYLRLYRISPEIAETWHQRLEHAGYDVLRHQVSDQDARLGVVAKGFIERAPEKVEIVVLSPDSEPPEVDTICEAEPLTGRYSMLVRACPTGRWPWSPPSMALVAEVEQRIKQWGSTPIGVSGDSGATFDS